MASKHIGLRISEEDESTLNQLAQTMQKTKSKIVREAISLYLEDFVDYVEGLRILKCNEKSYSLEEIEKTFNE